jgi:hypothetical protein
MVDGSSFLKTVPSEGYAWNCVHYFKEERRERDKGTKHIRKMKEETEE